MMAGKKLFPIVQAELNEKPAHVQR
jgi:hypothetical protein